MENDNQKLNTASHYFMAANSTVFDELNKTECEKVIVDQMEYGKPTNVVGEKPTYFANMSAFSCISTPGNKGLSDAILNAPPDSLSNLSLEVDRTHDAWIPSPSTKETLDALASNPGTYKVDKNLLVTPGIAIKEEFGDPVKNLLVTYFGEEAASKRQSLVASMVTQDDRGLRQLISCGCYHAAVNLTTQLLAVYGQGERKSGQIVKHTAHSIQLWFTRISLLVKLRRFSMAEVECDPLGDLDAPDLFFQFYPELYGGRKGSMVPFSFRVLVAELPQYLGKHSESLDRLCKLLATCNKILDNLRRGLAEDGSDVTSKCSAEVIEVWGNRRIRLLYSLTRCAVSLKDIRLAGALLQRLLKEKGGDAGLFSALGRLCLLLGDIGAAQECFRRHLEHSPTGGEYDPVQGLVHSAFVACARSDFENAKKILQQAYEIGPDNAMVINNLVVCMIFVGEIREAIKLVEKALSSSPEKLLHEALVLNLATMYELESSIAHKKKLELLSLVAAHKGDGFNVAALKLQA